MKMTRYVPFYNTNGILKSMSNPSTSDQSFDVAAVAAVAVAVAIANNCETVIERNCVEISDLNKRERGNCFFLDSYARNKRDRG